LSTVVKARPAWPTLAVLALALALYGATWLLVLDQRIAPWLACALFSLATYAAFTPFHEAAHGLVFASRAGNALVGHLLAPLYGPTGSFSAYRYLHLRHHADTNHPRLDPDHYSTGRPLSLPWRWATQDLYYLWFMMRHRREVPLRTWVETYAANLAHGALLALLLAHGAGSALIWYWLVPARVATALLSLLFNYLPHIPYDTLAADDRYRATNLVAGPRWLTSALFMFHNYHLIHHLYPRTPFFRYRHKLKANQRKLAALGVRVVFGDLSKVR
jgi:fatty acid desaturase